MNKAELVDKVATTIQLPRSTRPTRRSRCSCSALSTHCVRGSTWNCGVLGASGCTIARRAWDATRKRVTRSRFQPGRSPGFKRGKISARE